MTLDNKRRLQFIFFAISVDKRENARKEQEAGTFLLLLKKPEFALVLFGSVDLLSYIPIHVTTFGPWFQVIAPVPCN